MKNTYLIFISCLLALVPLVGYSSVNALVLTEDSLGTKNQFVGYPIAFYLPETRWGFGAAGFYIFRFKGEDVTTNPSQVQLAVTYTQNKQVIFLMPFEVYHKNNVWKFKGELGYFRYQFNYFGIGSDSRFQDKEAFKATFPRFRLDILRRYRRFYAGIRLGFDHFDINGTKEFGLIDVHKPVGSHGGITSGAGVLAQYDSRNFLFNPTKGMYCEAESFIASELTGSAYNYRRFTFSGARYQKLAENHTLATQVVTMHNYGNPPFFDMAFFGTPKVMRGFQDRRFLDKNLLVFQCEYRFPIFKRLQGVSFVSTGKVAGTYRRLFENDFKTAYGAGLRVVLNKKDRVRLRIDYGRAKGEGGAFYATINEAF
jgi:outer membrane protein assembly factor BamA